jgi:hypothetical protein
VLLLVLLVLLVLTNLMLVRIVVILLIMVLMLLVVVPLLSHVLQVLTVTWKAIRAVLPASSVPRDLLPVVLVLSTVTNAKLVLSPSLLVLLFVPTVLQVVPPVLDPLFVLSV